MGFEQPDPLEGRRANKLTLLNLKMNLGQTNNRSLLHGISINAKDKLIWSGSYEALQMFVEEVLNMSDCPGGDAKRYKSGNVDMRWYQDSKSITLSGELKDEIKEKLILLASVTEQVTILNIKAELMTAIATKYMQILISLMLVNCP